MTTADVEVHEATASRRTESVPLAHLSVELGHFYYGDLGNGFDFFQQHFGRIGRWLAATREAWTDTTQARAPRFSTCVLIDDYFERPGTPSEVLPQLIDAARAADLEIDYVVRESACATADEGLDGAPNGVSLAELTQARLVEEPPRGSTGARPPARETGWLCNGLRSPVSGRHEAMKEAVRWLPPKENVATNHSIFTDVELWDHPDDKRKGVDASADDASVGSSAQDGEDGEDDHAGQDGGSGGRRWSCAMLAAVWQLMRLGMLRDEGAAVAVPRPMPSDLPDDWGRLPAVTRVNEHAAPFSAYRTMSICAPLFLPVEHAVRLILERVAIDPDVLTQIHTRSRAEGIVLPEAMVDRIEYLFVDTGPVRGVGPG